MRIIFIFLCWGGALFTHAQSSFNVVQDYGYPINHFRDVCVHNDTIYGLGIAYDTSISPLQAVLLVRLDSNAQVLTKKLYYDSLERNLTITGGFYRDKLQPTSDGGFLFLTATPESRNAILYKLDKDLNVEKIIEFPNEDNLRSNFEYKALEVEQGYLLYGFIQKQDYQILGFVRLVTKAGEKIWEKRYPYNGYNNFLNSAQLLSDSTVLITHNVSENFSLFKVYYGLRVIDLATGETIKYVDVSNLPQDQSMWHSIALSDGSVVLFSNELVGPNTQYYQTRSVFSKYNSDLELEWKRYWGVQIYGSQTLAMYDSHIDQQGNIISMGKTHRDTNYLGIPNFDYPMGWFFKYSVHGDSIWERVVTIPGPYDITLTAPILYAGGILSSGSIIGGGMVRSGNTYQIWLIKITNDGCLDTLFCQPVSAIETPAAVAPGLDVFPNPASDLLRIGYQQGAAGGYVRLLDLQGRLWQEQPLPASGGLVEIPVNNLPDGLYVAQWFCNGQAGYVKVVIAR